MIRYPVENAFNFENVANDILQMANDLIGKHEFFVSFVDDTILKVLKVKNKIVLNEGVSMPIEETYCQYVFKGKEPVLIENSLLDERTKNLHATTLNKMCSYAGVPIILKNGIIFGTVCAQNNEPKLFDDKTIGILERLAKFLSYVVDLETLIIKDPLTSLYNRYFWNKILSDLEGDGSTHSFLMFDLDSFKQINDCLGHDIGDSVLRNVSEILLEIIPFNAYAFRFGGDEFGVLFMERNEDEVMQTVKKLISSCGDIKLDRGQKINISGGLVDTSQVLLKELMIKADQLLYESKKIENSYVSQI